MVCTSSSSSCGLSLGPGDGYLLGGGDLAGELLPTDPPLAGEVFFNGEVEPAVLLAEEALGGDGLGNGGAGAGYALLTNSANSL